MKVSIKGGKIAIDGKELNEKECETLFDDLKVALSNAKEWELEKRYPLPEKIKNSANQYVKDCLYEYESHGSDYAPALEHIAKYQLDNFKGLNKITLVNLLEYILKKNSHMDLPVSVLIEELKKNGAYNNELIMEILRENKDLAI